MTSGLLLIGYVAAAVVALLSVWLLVRHTQERRWRRRVWVAPAYGHWPEATPPPAAARRYQLALIGDTGAVATTGPDSVLRLLQEWQQAAGEASATVLLGDNVYPTGIPPQSAPGRPDAERRLLTQLQSFESYAGQVIFLSGNHDWNKGRPNGLEYVLRQQQLVHEHLPAAHFLPANGLPGPVTLQLAPGILLVVLNTQWWVQQGQRPSATAGGRPFQDLLQILRANQHQQIIVAGHHPLYSNAIHGGKFTARQHMFPLTTVHKKAYLPLPLIGSLLPVYRKLVGAAEDMAHPRYRHLRRRLLRVLHQFPNLIYAAGHDHNLQYFQRQGSHYLVSGAGSKTAFVQHGGRAAFVHEHKGFFVLEFYQNAEVWLRVLEPGTPPGTDVFRWQLIRPGRAAAPAPAGSQAASEFRGA
ncbi:metallophosphoesterase [Hymenobacter guriensis]|uniref:metallophosphoesterase n=1 Tax=Hymenobacter guriensis TaxID=2793065 RepID=UPI00293D50F3|nr:metallophosphoesterase [Hymenobacter guriensis]